MLNRIHIIAVTLLLVPSAASANTLVDWNVISGELPDSVDGIDLVQIGSPPAPQLTADGVNLTTISDSDYLYYEIGAPGIDFNVHDEIAFTLRVEESSTSQPAREAAVIGAITDFGQGFGLWIGSGRAVFGAATGNAAGETAILDTTVFHDYKINLEGTDVGNTVTLSIDGVETISGSILSSVGNFGAENSIRMGDGTRFSSGSSTWKSISVSSTLAPVPIPATLPLMGFALAALILGTRRHS